MDRKKTLTLLLGVVVITGIVMAAIPFIASMSPNEVAKNSARTRVAISSIPESGALVVDLRFYRALIVKYPNIAVFMMPFYEGIYQLPDPTWERALVPCKNFVIGDAEFSCQDSSLHESWSEEARWDYSGKNLGTWMPDLQVARFKTEGGYIILSPEYN